MKHCPHVATENANSAAPNCAICAPKYIYELLDECAAKDARIEELNTRLKNRIDSDGVTVFLTNERYNELCNAEIELAGLKERVRELERDVEYLKDVLYPLFFRGKPDNNSPRLNDLIDRLLTRLKNKESRLLALEKRCGDVEGLEIVIDTRKTAWHIARDVKAWLTEGGG